MKLINKTRNKLSNFIKDNKNPIKYIFLILKSIYLIRGTFNKPNKVNIISYIVFILLQIPIFLNDKVRGSISSKIFLFTIVSYVYGIIAVKDYNLLDINRLINIFLHFGLILNTPNNIDLERVIIPILYEFIRLFIAFLILKTKIFDKNEKKEYATLVDYPFLVKDLYTEEEFNKVSIFNRSLLNVVLTYIVLAPSINYLGGKFILDKYIL